MTMDYKSIDPQLHLMVITIWHFTAPFI